MPHFKILLATIFFMYAITGKSQEFKPLNKLENRTVSVYFSSGHKERASAIGNRVEKALNYYSQLLGVSPNFTLLVLSQADWTKFSKQVVYGMPHYRNDSTLIVAAADNEFWRSFIPPLDQLPTELRENVQATYKNEKGELSMQPFFDLLALHELGHAFHFQSGIEMQRKWMGELFVNILLHTYIAEREPGSLPALSLFPRMVVSGGKADFKFTTLDQVEQYYDEIAQKFPRNYGWYQCRWHVAAGDIYDSAGQAVARKLWTALQNQKEKLDDQQLLMLLEKSVHHSLSDMIRNWD